jgi:hypothetical protein
MSKRLRVFVLVTTVLVVALGLPAVAQAKAAPTVTKPVFSATPVAGVPFTASGLARPKATTMSRTVVKVGLYALEDGRWVVRDLARAKLVAGASGTQYSRRLTVPAEGKYGVRAFHYRAGKLVAKSALAAFDVARRITIDSMVNGWMAPSLADTVVSEDTPLDVVFTTPSDWASDDPEKHYGAAHFIWGEFEKVDADGLIWHTDGLQPGRYDWMRDSMPKYGTGCLVVAQRIEIDKMSHEDTHAQAYLPADISFGDVSSAGMGCDRSIAFVTRIFSQTSADPLEWHTDGLVPGGYDWKCWMDDCHYGKLVVDDAADVAVDSDPHDVVTNVAASTPFDFVFTGKRMMCWRTINFTTAGSDLTKTTSFTPTTQTVTWHTDGLAAGSYEWECWMGPQCHHGTVVVE